MTSFWFYSAILLAVALLFVVVPVIRYRSPAKAGDGDIRGKKNIQVYKQGLEQLEQDKDDRVITEEEYARLKTELQRSFLRDMEDREGAPRRMVARANKLIPLLCILFVPVFSYSLYEVVGSARDLALPDIMAGVTGAKTQEEQQQALNDLAAFLQKRYDRNEEDIQNGYMLGTLYLELENYPAAVDIFSSMADIMDPGRDKATVLGQLAQSKYLAAGSKMTDEVQAIVDQTLELNPNEYSVMSLLAIEAFINQDFKQAVAYWRRQLLQLDGNSREAAVLKDRISRVEELIPEAEREQVATSGASVSLVINIDDSVRDLIDDSMRLFVYARNPAMPMPLAAQNLALPDFPFEITLDDSMAMIANMNLSTAQNVIVGARISRSGQATAQPGDIQAVSQPFALADQDGPVSLTIKDIVQ